MSLIQQVINKATLFARIRTRAGAVSSSLLQSKEFRDLFDTVSRVNAEDFKYNSSQFFPGKSSHSAPCSCMGIVENETLTASVFTLRQRREIPLHDHPTMFGILKVIRGRVRVTSYSHLTANQRSQLQEEMKAKGVGGVGQRIGNFKQSADRLKEGNLIPVIEHPECILGMDDPPAVLTPTEYNFHRNQGMDDETAFFHILMPPYNQTVPSLECHFYRTIDPKVSFFVTPAISSVSALRRRSSETEEIDQGPSYQQQSPTSSSSKVSIGWLMRIPMSRTYYSESVPYRGPPVKSVESLTEAELREEIKKIV